MTSTIKSMLLSAAVVVGFAGSANAAPFARVTVKTPTQTIIELGNDQGFFANNLATGDIGLNGGSIVGQVLAAALAPWVPVQPGVPAVRWDLPDVNTLRFTISNLNLMPYAVNVKICDPAGVCADNTERLPRHVGAASATCGGVAPCTDGLAAVHAVASEWTSVDWSVGAFEMTVDRPTLVTGLEWLYAKEVFQSGPVAWSTLQPKLNIWSSQAALLLSPGHGDVSDWGNFTFAVPSTTFEQTAGTDVYKLEMTYTGNNQAGPASIMLYPGNTYIVSPFMYTTLESSIIPMSANQIGVGDYYMGGWTPLVPLTYLPQTWTSSTIAVDLFGVNQP